MENVDSNVSMYGFPFGGWTNTFVTLKSTYLSFSYFFLNSSLVMVLVIFLFKYILIISSSELICCSICLCNVESLSLIKKSIPRSMSKY